MRSAQLLMAYRAVLEGWVSCDRIASMTSVSRRRFLASLPAALPVVATLTETKPRKIEAVEVWQYRGTRQTTRGKDAQYQVNPLYIYDELRPAPYRDNPQSDHGACRNQRIVSQGSRPMRA